MRCKIQQLMAIRSKEEIAKGSKAHTTFNLCTRSLCCYDCFWILLFCFVVVAYFRRTNTIANKRKKNRIFYQKKK